MPTEATNSRTASAPSPSSATTWALWIDGREHPSSRSDLFDVYNPATGEVMARVARGGAAEIDAAVVAARRALREWADMPVIQRSRILFEVADRMRADIDGLARIETLNNGKPLREARQDVDKSAEAFEFYAGLADKFYGATIPISPQFLNYTLREPIGVTGHIAPWNFPLRLSVRSIAPALAVGNTVVLKPAEQTPLSALRLARLLAEAGIPPGVFNVVPGPGRDAGARLAGHPDVNHVSFTGSVETGIAVMKMAAENVVPVTLELGGKSPNIVFADADIDAALAGTMKAIFTNAGQVCCAGTRLLVEQSAYDRFVERLVERTAAMRIGPGIDDPDMGPLISQAQQNLVLDYIDLGQREGGRVLAGGKRPSHPACGRGYFVEPTLIANVDNAARVAQEEIFGPVLTIFRVPSDEEAVRLANDSPFGLVAGVWTTNLDRAHRVAARLNAGQVYVNDFFSGSVSSPFGGYKKSGFGRERGVEALHHYTQVKSVCIRFKG